MKVPIVFGKRDQAKYAKVIHWLNTIEDGWRNQAVKEALLEYVLTNEDPNQTITTTKPSIPKEYQETQVKNQSVEKVEDDYSETTCNISLSDSPKKEDDNLDKINSFLGDF